MASIKFEMKPTAKQLRKDHTDRIKKLRNSGRAFAKASILLDRWVQRNFKTEGDEVGGWKDFSYGGRVVKKSKANALNLNPRVWINTTAKLLQDTGRLRASFIPFSNRFNAGIGSTLKYSKKHHEGIGVDKRRLLPNRSDKDLMRQVKSVMRNHVNKAIK